MGARVRGRAGTLSYKATSVKRCPMLAYGLLLLMLILVVMSLPPDDHPETYDEWLDRQW